MFLNDIQLFKNDFWDKDKTAGSSSITYIPKCQQPLKSEFHFHKIWQQIEGEVYSS